MNKQQKAQIEKLVNQLDLIAGDLEALQSDAQDSLDNTPEQLRPSEAEDHLENIASAVSNLQSAVDDLNSIG